VRGNEQQGKLQQFHRSGLALTAPAVPVRLSCGQVILVPAAVRLLVARSAVGAVADARHWQAVSGALALAAIAAGRRQRQSAAALSPLHAASVSGSITSAVRTEQTAHPIPSGRVSACQEDLEPVSGFEPLTVRLQEGR
jgi:hypothetical protein